MKASDRPAYHRKKYSEVGNRYRACVKYYGMLERVRKDPDYRGVSVLCSKEEFIAWFQPKDFLGCAVDRIDPNGDYKIDNMQVITITENCGKDKKAKKFSNQQGICRVCKEQKAEHLFRRHTTTKNGRETLCKACDAKKAKEYREKKKQQLTSRAK